MKTSRITLFFLLFSGLLACSSEKEEAQANLEIQEVTQEVAQDIILEEAPPQIEEVPELTAIFAETLKPFKGDFEAMVNSRTIRVLVVYNKTNYFLDGATPRGIHIEAIREFQKALNKELNLGNRPLHVVAIPVLRDQLIPFLEEGRGDIAMASLTVTSERASRIDFSVPSKFNVSELLVTGPLSPQIMNLDDLAGKQVVVRSSSSYFESLNILNESFKERGLEEIIITSASEYLETEDLLEMLNAGLIGITVADDYLANFWSQVFPDLMVHEGLSIATGQSIGWAIRKDAVGLKEKVDSFVNANRAGTLLGNILFKRYLQDTKYVENALAEEGSVHFETMLEHFRQYAEQYNFDYRLVAAQGFQESGLNQSVVSDAGAIGVMQLLPSTAADKSVGIPDISQASDNIHAGVKYLRYIVDNYFDDEEIDEFNSAIFAFASYNAGPNRIRRLRKVAEESGYDPNVWFNNVEVVVSNQVGREPVQYVRNILKYYTAFSLVIEQNTVRQSLSNEP